MNGLWDLEQATSGELRAALGQRMALTTLLTYLTRLEAKGYVRREPGERGHVYRPAIERHRVAGRLLDQVLGQFGGGITSLVNHFVRTRRLSAEEQQALRQLLDELDQEDRAEEGP
jgi:BlaI family transcriptional regulator, penicillinase repressor